MSRPPSLLDHHDWPSVTSIELLRVRLPLRRAHVYAGGVEDAREVVLVHAVAADGVQGWGECSALSSPGYTEETTSSSWRALGEQLAPAWLHDHEVPRDPPMAHAALEVTAIDIALRRRNVSLTDALAEHFGPPRPRLAWCAVLGLEANVADIEQALADGASQVKLKVSSSRDVDHVVAARRSFPDAALAVDANGSYRSVEDVPAVLDDLGLSYVEQPLGVDDLRGSAELAERFSVPVALDESITSVGRLKEALDAGACSVVSLKPGRLGGLDETVGALSLVQEHDRVRAFVGGMLETAVGRAVALAVAAQAPCSMPCDAGPTARYFATDVGEAFDTDVDGLLAPPDGSGVGRTPDATALDAFALDRVVLEP